MVLKFLFESIRKVKSSEPASEPCANCGEDATDMEVIDTSRFCFVPLFRKSHHEIMCTKCEWKAGEA